MTNVKTFVVKIQSIDYKFIHIVINMTTEINLKALREQKELSQQELADAIGVPKSRLAKWEERGKIPKKEDYDLVHNYFKDKISQTKNTEPIQNLPDLHTQMLLDLISSNKILVGSNKDLVDQTSRLTRMVEANSNDHAEISRAVNAKIATFLGSLAEVLVEAPFASKQEALTRLNKVLSDVVAT